MNLFILYFFGFLHLSNSFLIKPNKYFVLNKSFLKKPSIFGNSNELPITIKPPIENITSNISTTSQNDLYPLTSTYQFPIIPGITLGIPLNILSYFFTTHHYHEYILTPKISLILCLIGTYTYGNDKLNDALYTFGKKQEYILENFDTLKNIYSSFYFMFSFLLFENDGISPNTYFALILYTLSKFFYNFNYTFFSYYLGIRSDKILPFYLIFLWNVFKMHTFDHELLFLPFLILLDSTNSYLQIKKKIGILKPFYVAFMWTMSFFILPAVIHDQSYEIFSLESLPDILSPFLLMSGFSNLLDIKDIKTDRIDKINTIPVSFGVKPTIWISGACLILFFLVLYYS